mmetsp:Transcript_24743/g.58823  ORF Transcript_24743/g.58823 Transcript_24743/m.58823 type:complete len:443 (-) Transcript_24743:113-1441(-)
MVNMIEPTASTASVKMDDSWHSSSPACKSVPDESNSQRSPENEAAAAAGQGKGWEIFALIKSGSEHSLGASRRSQDSGMRALIKSGSDSSISSMDSEKLVSKMTRIPFPVRGRAEAWETPREQIELLHKLGPGTGGEVYLCKWRGLTCAAKLLDQSMSSSSHEDMVNEISVMSHIRHPNLVMFLGAVSVSEPLIILTEYMEGGTVQNRYEEKRKALGKPWRPPRTQAVKWMLDVARAVCFLHNCRFRAAASAYDGSESINPITHRDLKPLNLLLTNDDVLKVTAYGLSKTLDREGGGGGAAKVGGGHSVLDEAYSAPEVRSCQSYSEKADIYSMAMVFYFLLTGEKPSNETESAPPQNALVPAVVSAPAAESAHRPSVAKLKWRESEHLIASMWAENPDDRPDATTVVKGLNLLLLHHNEAQRASEDKALRARCSAGQCSVM